MTFRPYAGLDCFHDPRCDVEGNPRPCPKHPKYQGKRPPKRDCKDCKQFYETRNDYGDNGK